jgi:hypothetical protein
MQTILKGIDRITTPLEFEYLKCQIEALISEATDNGSLATQGANNIYTCEIARLARIGARYEDEFLHLTVGKKRQPAKQYLETVDELCAV